MGPLVGAHQIFLEVLSARFPVLDDRVLPLEENLREVSTTAGLSAVCIPNLDVPEQRAGGGRLFKCTRCGTT